jgi:hypothetical protein
LAHKKSYRLVSPQEFMIEWGNIRRKDQNGNENQDRPPDCFMKPYTMLSPTIAYCEHDVLAHTGVLSDVGIVEISISGLDRSPS